jgi:hypothetical protein
MNTETPFDPRPAVIAELAKLGLAAEPLHVNKIKIVGDSEDATTDHFVELRMMGRWNSRVQAVEIGHRAKSIRYKLKPGNKFNAEGAAAHLVEMHRHKLQARVDMEVRHAGMNAARATLKRTVEMLGSEDPRLLHGMHLDATNVYTDKVMVKIWESFTPGQVVRLHALLATFKQEA